MTMKYSIAVYMIVILLYVHVPSARSISRRSVCPNEPRNKFIIDTDAGGDDALALMLALMYETKTCDIKILAITCTYGNVYVENVTQNVLKILTVANRSDIPVYIGSHKPLLDIYKFNDYFGEDGFGDFNFAQSITAEVNISKNASMLLVDLVKKYPDEITIITLGPLTNIAEAILLEPEFLNYAKQLVIMGSNASQETEISESPEFNFKQDPESDWLTLTSINKTCTVLPINTVLAHAISKEKRRNIFNKMNYSVANFLTLAERKALEKTEFWEPADGMTMAIALQPEIITESFETNLEPILGGDKCGAVIVNFNNTVYNAKVIQSFNVTAFENLITEYLS